MLLLICEGFWELVSVNVHICLTEEDISDNEARLCDALLMGVNAATSMLWKKSLERMVDDNELCADLGPLLMDGGDTMIILSL